MKDNELIEVLKEFEKKRIEQLPDNPKKLFYAIMKIADERDELKNNINKAITNINILQEIIYQQSTNNGADDMWLLDKLDGIKNCFIGDKDNA